MGQRPKLDHTVINVRFDMDQGESAFADLGFKLTKRGYHSLGSINHLMVFNHDYLELIGLPADQRSDPGRPEIAAAPVGINGLVFKTEDVAAEFTHLQALGMAGNPPKSFSRPVTLEGGVAEARFRTVHLSDDVFPGGRVYFCQHLTPDLVWRPEWQKHGNRAVAVSELVVASENHTGEAAAFAELLYSDVIGSGDELEVALDGALIRLVTPQAYEDRYGALASPMGARPSIFGALVLRTGDLAAAGDAAERAGLPAMIERERVVVREPSFDSVLEFVA